MSQLTDPQPWTCSECGARLQWRRTSIYCPNHGELCTLPAWPDNESEQPT